MKIKDEIGTHSRIMLMLTGIAAGFTNGLLGAGGGILIVFGMSSLLKNDPDGGRDVFANALAVMMPISVVSVISYLLSGRMLSESFNVYLIPTLLGGLVGGFLLDRLKLPLLKKMFAIIVIWSGIYMILRG